MFTDILKKYMNVFIIILYVYILYSYDFKDNIQLLLVITGIFIYIIYKNKGNAFTNDIIEGNTNDDTGGTTGATTGGTTGATTGGTSDSRRRILEILDELRSELESMDDGNTVDRNDPRVDELLRLYLEVNPNLELNLPNIFGGEG